MSFVFPQKYTPDYYTDFNREVPEFLGTKLKEKKKYKIVTWNVNGFRSHIVSDKKCINMTEKTAPLTSLCDTGGLLRILEDSPDILCMQETRLSIAKTKKINMKGWEVIASQSNGEGARGPDRYSGVSVWLNKSTVPKPLQIVTKFECDPVDEGRIIAMEFPEDTTDEPRKTWWLVNLYVPNSGTNFDYRTGPWSKNLDKFLCDKENVVVCGDMNVARTIYDLSSGKSDGEPHMVDLKMSKQMKAGFRDEEREWMDTLVKRGYVDVWRELNPDKKWEGYTYVDARYKSRWRIDYFLINFKTISWMIKNTSLFPYNGKYSDHIPLIMEINM